MGPRRRSPSSPRVASPSDTCTALVMIPGAVKCFDKLCSVKVQWTEQQPV
jgi:hypothetical protein